MTFHRLGFTFVRSCTVVENTFAKERYFSDNLKRSAYVAIEFMRYFSYSLEKDIRTVFSFSMPVVFLLSPSKIHTEIPVCIKKINLGPFVHEKYPRKG